MAAQRGRGEILEVFSVSEPLQRNAPPPSAPPPSADRRRWVGPLVVGALLAATMIVLGISGDDAKTAPPITPATDNSNGLPQQFRTDPRLRPVIASPPSGYHLAYTGAATAVDRAPGVTELWDLHRRFATDAAWLFIVAARNDGDFEATGEQRIDLGAPNGVAVIQPQRNGDDQIVFHAVSDAGEQFRVSMVAHRWDRAELVALAATTTVTGARGGTAIDFGASPFPDEQTLVGRLTGELGANPWSIDVQRYLVFADDAGTFDRIRIVSGPAPDAKRAALLDALLQDAVSIGDGTVARYGTPFGDDLTVLRFQRDGITITVSGRVPIAELVDVAGTVRVAEDGELEALGGTDPTPQVTHGVMVDSGLMPSGETWQVEVSPIDAETASVNVSDAVSGPVEVIAVTSPGISVIATADATFVIAFVPLGISNAHLTITSASGSETSTVLIAGSDGPSSPWAIAGGAFTDLGPWSATLSAPDGSVLASTGGG